MADPLSAFYDPLRFLYTKNYIPIQIGAAADAQCK